MSLERAIIVAHDRRRAIGVDGQLPWHLPKDLQHFKALTLGHTVLMGRKTFASIGRALPGRDNWVLTRDRDWQTSGVRVFHHWSEALAAHQHGILWIIGGGEIYLAALEFVTRIESTEVDTEVDRADTWFAPLDQSWQISERQSHPADQRHAFPFEFVSRVRGLPATQKEISR